MQSASPDTDPENEGRSDPHLSLGTALCASPSALVPPSHLSGAWSYTDPRIPVIGRAIFRLLARHREMLQARTSWHHSLSYSGKEATAKMGGSQGYSSTRYQGRPSEMPGQRPRPTCSSCRAPEGLVPASGGVGELPCPSSVQRGDGCPSLQGRHGGGTKGEPRPAVAGRDHCYLRQ